MKDSQILSKILVDNYWHLVGHKSELMNDKDYIKLDLLNNNIIRANGKSGVTRVQLANRPLCSMPRKVESIGNSPG